MIKEWTLYKKLVYVCLMEVNIYVKKLKNS